MKTYEIISEVSVPGGLGTALKTGIKAGIQAFKNVRSGAAGAVDDVARAVSGTADDAARAARSVAGTADDAARVAQIEKGSLSAADRKAVEYILKKGAEVDQKEFKMLLGMVRNQYYKDKADSIVNLVWGLDIAQEAAKYYARTAQLNPNDPDYESKLRTLRGEFILGVIGPKVAYWVMKPGRFILNAIPGAMKMVGFSNQAEFLKIISSTATKVALTTWFATDAGKKALTNLFGGGLTEALGMGFEGAQGIYEFAKAGVQVATGNTPAGFKSSDDPGSGSSEMDSAGGILGKIIKGGGETDLYKQVGRGSGL